MKIINTSKGKTLADNAWLAQSLKSRLVGLLNRESLNPGEALVIKPCNSIHTFFMRFPIDVLFVDKNNKVIEAISSLAPFRLSKIYCSSLMVIELPAGIIQATSTKPSDILYIF